MPQGGIKTNNNKLRWWVFLQSIRETHFKGCVQCLTVTCWNLKTNIEQVCCVTIRKRHPQIHKTHLKRDQNQHQESHYFHGCPSLWLEFPVFGLQCQLKPDPWYPPAKSAHPIHSCPSLPSPPSLPHSRLRREEWAETPHWPRWLAANQLQPKVIGSRWETFWWRERGGDKLPPEEEEKEERKTSAKPKGNERETARV